MPVRVLTTDLFPSMKNQIGAVISLEGRGFQQRRPPYWPLRTPVFEWQGLLRSGLDVLSRLRKERTGQY
jgi:hypothetical protein